MKTLWFRDAARRGTMAAALALAAFAASAADLSDKPLGTMTNGTAVRSNLMFVLDDSGSMDNNYLPDDPPAPYASNNWSDSAVAACFGAASVNTLFYDPTRTYLAPLQSDGTSKPNASFTGAWKDGYNPGTTVNLTNNNPETADVPGVVISQTVSTSGPTVCGTKDNSACSTNSSTTSVPSGANTVTTVVDKIRKDASPKTCRNSWQSNSANSCTLTSTTTVTTYGPSGKFLWATRKSGASATSCAASDFDIVRYSASLTTAQLTNYANWYAYYRTRLLAMRAGAGRAFAKIDASRFRVGFATIHNKDVAADGTRFLHIRDYDGGTQKTDFFGKLYSTTTSPSPNQYTPLRPALEWAGKYFAKKLPGQTVDPVQYSCQRNYTILSTDGYWNTADETDFRSPYLPQGPDGTTIGNVDAGSAVDRPMRDEAGTGKAGVANTLADIAMRYYETDLRSSALGNCSGAVSGQDVCENNVPSDGKKDTATYQHMTTFTIGLGVNGALTYDKNYESQSSGDFHDITQGTKVWPDPNTTSSSNTVTARIDDLWHAAVNGRGHYYSANDSLDLANSLTEVLSRIEAIAGSSSAAATSSLTPSSGDDWLFIPLYTTKTWEGTVNAYRINTATGAVLDSSKPIWSASDRIKGQIELNARNIYFRDSTATGGLASFTHAKLSSAGKATAFEDLCLAGAEKLTQCTALSAAARAKVTGPNVVEFLRGTASLETSAAAPDDQLFRARTLPMGDIVNGAPVYVKKPPFKYVDAGYASFASAKSGRQAVLYVAANDGMLHALKVSDDTTGGSELWAYVPSMVMSNMYLLADTAYESKHRFFVDGAPVVGDVYDGSGWRTILVGGLGKGGRGYYALDVTDPTAPKSLWEFTDTDLGYSYGNPVITKNKAGTWVVAFSSGYENGGEGQLYVVNAVTGSPIKKIATTSGTTNNLGKINAWVDDDTDNVAKRIYGGDMLGNVWRFDFDDNLPGADAFLLAQLGSSQPITTKPVLSEVVVGASKTPVVSVATGRYLGVSDIGDGSMQSIYTFKDSLSTTSLGALRSNSSMVKQTLKADRSGLDSPATVTWATQSGWYVDLKLTSGERVNVDFDQQFNQLVVASNIPTPTVCSPGGTSWLYYFDVGSGKVLLTYAGDTLVAGITTIVSSTGKLITLMQGVDGKNTPRQGVDPSSSTPGVFRRASWRELVE